MIVLVMYTNCKDIRQKFFPERAYEKANIDNFYWAVEGSDYVVIPLIKPYQLSRQRNDSNWILAVSFSEEDYLHYENIYPVNNKINVSGNYIYGIKDGYTIEDNKEVDAGAPYAFILNAKERKIKTYLTEAEFLKELKKLNLPDNFLNPEGTFEQYKLNPVLPWFPEEIKQQLNKVSQQKKSQ